MQKIVIVTDAWEPQVNGVVRTLKKIQELIPDTVFITPLMFERFPMPGYPEIELAFVGPKSINKILSKYPDHLIHIATEGPIGLFARLWCSKNNRKFTTSYHTKFPEFLEAYYKIPSWITYLYFQWFHSKSSAVMVATKSLYDFLQSIGFKNLIMWNRGVDLDKFWYAGPKKNKDPVFLYVGRVSKEKGIEDFLSLNVPGIKKIVGDGPELDTLKRKYPEAIFTGTLLDKELTEAYNSADVFVFPSKNDTFGLVIIEALACGLPVVAYPVTGPIDILTEKTGVMSDNLLWACNKALTLNPKDCVEHSKKFSWKLAIDLFKKNLNGI